MSMESRRPAMRRARRLPAAGSGSSGLGARLGPRPIVPDRYRHFVFPNRMRELRRKKGFPKLLALAAMLPDIPYIRLSKIERGEVFARADELVRIAGILAVGPRDLLIDIDDPAFDIAAWSEPFQDGRAVDEAQERFAIMLAAATRARRAGSAGITIAMLDRDYGIPPVILSRIENAHKPLDRWNDATVDGLCRFFGVADAHALRALVESQYRDGLLDGFLDGIADAGLRRQKTREGVARLAQELASTAPGLVVEVLGPVFPEREPEAAPAAASPRAAAAGAVRLLPVIGAPLPGGLIAPAETGLTVEAPRAAGPRAFGLRICRPSLGAGLPGNAVVVADPDVFPSSGGLAVIREGGNYRLLAVTFDRSGAMTGHSLNPDLEVSIDAMDPADVAAVLSASFG